MENSDMKIGTMLHQKPAAPVISKDADLLEISEGLKPDKKKREALSKSAPLKRVSDVITSPSSHQMLHRKFSGTNICVGLQRFRTPSMT